jgi:D-alanyl-D-alanine carboxypeptidase
VRNRRMKKSLPILLFLGVLLFCLGLFQHWVLPAADFQPSIPPSVSKTTGSSPDDREPSGEEGSGKEAESFSSEEALPVNKNSWELVLVNAEHSLEEEYPVELEAVEGYQFDKRAAGALREMIAAAERDGIRLILISTYRSFEKSEWNFAQKVQALLEEGYSEEEARLEAQRWVAPPGTSEHNTGLAADIVSGDYFDVYGRELETEFEGYQGFRWLYDHCADYGFILRYPDGKEEITGIHYEPWHYRYVGAGHAVAIMERGITLEEYLGEEG